MIHVWRPDTCDELAMPGAAPPFVVIGRSKFRHLPVGMSRSVYSDGETYLTITTRCGLTSSRWRESGKLRQPCRRCFA